MNPVCFVFNGDDIQFPINRTILDKIQNQNTYNDLVNWHRHVITSNVRLEIFNEFLNYLRTDEIPTINGENFVEYSQLSNEFGVLERQIEAFQIDHLNLLQMLQNTNTNKQSIEKLISKHIDTYLIENPNEFGRIELSSLDRIFNDPERILNNHDNAYRFIINLAENQNRNYYVLLSYLDASKFTDMEILRESFMKRKEHCDFCPQNSEHFISILDNKILNLEQNIQVLESTVSTKTNELAEKSRINQNLETQISSLNQKLSSIKSRAQSVISQREFQVLQQLRNLPMNDIEEYFEKTSSLMQQICPSDNEYHKIENRINGQLVGIVREIASCSFI